MSDGDCTNSNLPVCGSDSRCRGAPGQLDRSFGLSGVVEDYFDVSRSDSPKSVTIDREGRILVSGVGSGEDIPSKGWLLRYHPDGAPDLTFSPPSFGAKSSLSWAIPGKDWILTFANNEEGQYLRRLTTQGSLDHRFGSNGDLAFEGSAGGLWAVSEDGSFVAGGSEVLRRVGPTGELERELAMPGIVPWNGFSDSEGRIYYSRASFVAEGQDAWHLVNRVLPDLSPDLTYGQRGESALKATGCTEIFSVRLRQLPNGSVVTLGRCLLLDDEGYFYTQPRLAKFQHFGTPHGSFGGTGSKVVAPRGEDAGLEVDREGRIFVLYSYAGEAFLVGLSEDGRAIGGFGTKGSLRLNDLGVVPKLFVIDDRNRAVLVAQGGEGASGDGVKMVRVWL